MSGTQVYTTAEAARDAAVAAMTSRGVAAPEPGLDFEVYAEHERVGGYTWIDARPDGTENTAEAEVAGLAAADAAEVEAPEPVAFTIADDLVAEIMALADARRALAQPVRKRVDPIEALFAASPDAIPVLPINSIANYTYSRHADALRKLALHGDLGGLKAYPVGGSNTYARRVQAYKARLVAMLGGGRP